MMSMKKVEECRGVAGRGEGENYEENENEDDVEKDKV